MYLAKQLTSRSLPEIGRKFGGRDHTTVMHAVRKVEELRSGIYSLNGSDSATDGSVKLLTSCPACQQGLNRYKDETGLEVSYIVEELARDSLGSNWQKAFVHKLKQGGIERVLL